MAIWCINLTKLIENPNFSDFFKQIIKHLKKQGIIRTFYAAVCMPSFEPNHG